MTNKGLEQKRRIKRPAGRFGVELDREEGLRDVDNALVRACGKRVSRLNEDVEAIDASTKVQVQ